MVSCPPGCSGTGACRVLQTCWTMGATHGKKVTGRFRRGLKRRLV